MDRRPIPRRDEDARPDALAPPPATAVQPVDARSGDAAQQAEREHAAPLLRRSEAENARAHQRGEDRLHGLRAGAPPLASDADQPASAALPPPPVPDERADASGAPRRDDRPAAEAKAPSGTEEPAGPAWPPGKPWPEAQPVGSGAPPEEIMIEFRDLYKSFGEKHILKGATMAIPRGVSAVIMGGSGTGKSVTIKHVVGLLKADKGEVWVHGQNVDELDKDALDQLRLKIGFLFQSGALFDSMTVFEQMDFVLKRHTDLDEAGRKDRIQETLEWVNLPSSAQQFPSELSGGQRKRAGLARSIILQPDIMVYDEPTTGLDPISVRVVSNLINRLRDERGITSITITHDLLCAEMISDQVFYLLDGVYAETGTLAEVAQSDKPQIREFFGDEYAQMFNK